jgi:hypothetical protein
MNEFIVYVLKSVLSLALFALVYRSVLINEGNFRMRRLFLLTSVSLAMLLPLFTFTIPFGNYSIPTVLLDEVIVYGNGIRLIKESSSFPVSQVVRVLYYIVSGFLLFRVLINTILVFLKSAKNDSDQNEGVKLFLLKDKNISYSFFKNIFIGQTEDKEELERIFAHEKVHAQQLHSIDVLYIELLTGLFWFNPLVWWYRDEIKNVHEYLADQGALETGFNRKSYQITLLEHLIGSASLSITNSFNYSLIKNRIAMMNKEKSSRRNIWKVFLLIPVSLIIAFAFACTHKSQVSAEASGLAQSQSNTVYLEADQMPEFSGGFEALSKFIATNITYPNEARENKVAGKVFVQFIVDQNGKIVTNTADYKVYDKGNKESTMLGEVVVVGYKPAEGSPTENTDKYVELLKKEAVRVISMLPDFAKPGMVAGKPVAVVFTIPINFALR